MAESTHAAGVERARGAPASTTTARIALPAAEFALYDLFERVPDARVELEPAVANPADHALLLVRATERADETVENALRWDSTVGMVERFGERGDGRTYRVTWQGRARRFVEQVVAEGVTLLNARARQGQWCFRLVAPDRESFASAYDAIADLGYEPDCQRISTFDGGRAGCTSLTEEQREALVEAFEAGYYDIPRAVTADELAGDLGISHQALSERFRRAYGQLIETALVVDDGNHAREP